MAEKTIAFGVTNAEYVELKARADKEGISVPQYVKVQVLAESSFNNYVQLLLKSIATLPPRSTFSVRSIMEEAGVWEDIPKGQKMALGRHFFTVARDNKEINVELFGNEGSNPVMYRKI
jgi:hypothetical protein